MADQCECHACISAHCEANPALPEDLMFGCVDMRLVRYFLCGTCGNKRCPRAADHRLACTGSNDPGQFGSLYEDQPMTNEPEPNTRAGEALKPCERCGGKPMLCEPNYADEGGTMVVCEDCDLAGDSFVLGEYGEGRAQAITAWNTRPLPQPSELVERAKQQIQLGKMTGSHTGSRLNIYQIAEELLTQIAKLQARLEVVPGWSEDADGIACRNDTIKLQDECIAKLQADGDKLAGALERSRQGWSNVLELGLLPVQHQSTALGLHEAATQALTEWKDRA